MNRVIPKEIGGKTPQDNLQDKGQEMPASPEVVRSGNNPDRGVVNFRNHQGDVCESLDFTVSKRVGPCLMSGRVIATPKGERPLADLKIGDPVITRDNGIQEIQWIGSHKFSRKDLAARPHLWPILVQRGALGNGLPERAMLVAPNQRLLVDAGQTALFFEERNALVPAKHLINNHSIRRIDLMGMAYVHFMFEQHQLVLSNGVWVESFQPADRSLNAEGNAQRNEVLELFPALQTAVSQPRSKKQKPRQAFQDVSLPAE